MMTHWKRNSLAVPPSYNKEFTTDKNKMLSKRRLPRRTLGLVSHHWTSSLQPYQTSNSNYQSQTHQQSHRKTYRMNSRTTRTWVTEWNDISDAALPTDSDTTQSYLNLTADLDILNLMYRKHSCRS